MVASIMKVHVLQQTQQLPISLDEAWSFFATPRNLDQITPKDLGFRITYSSSEKMMEGQIITYKIRIAPFIHLPWVTEITSVKEPLSFIDNQVSGPYSLWHHLHQFTPNEQGVLMTDLVHYALPFGPFGSIAHALFVKNKVASIFAYRKELLAELFRKK